MWVWRYRLTPRAPLSALAGTEPRRGALIRSGDGVADVHPWPELGDLPLDHQLALLARGKTTPLTAASLRFAAADGDARRRGVSLFDGVQVPDSHWPAGAGEPPAAFDTVKLKKRGGDAIDPAWLRYRLRIDYNGTLTPDQFLEERLPVESIDFIEDPVPYDESTWNELSKRCGLRLACDRGTGLETAADVIVVKPAVQTTPSTSKEVVVTSYMDHPIGQLGAAWFAAHYSTSRRAGLLTHLLYESDAFSERLKIDGMRLVPPKGTGFGFDDIIENLPWQKL